MSTYEIDHLQEIICLFGHGPLRAFERFCHRLQVYRLKHARYLTPPTGTGTRPPFGDFVGPRARGGGSGACARIWLKGGMCIDLGFCIPWTTPCPGTKSSDHSYQLLAQRPVVSSLGPFLVLSLSRPCLAVAVTQWSLHSPEEVSDH